MTSTEADTADWLLTPEAVRHHCGELFRAGLDGRLAHFALDMDRLPGAADIVCETIAADYPSLDIPPHARWRHFVIDGLDRWAEIAATLDGDRAERARVECELAITSVLLDAGAGPAWRYRDRRTGKDLARSEGLALASLELFAAGGFSSRRDNPLQADAAGLAAVTTAALERAFQVTPDNPLAGAEGRAALIRRLARVVAATPQVFGADRPRLGHLADHLLALSQAGRIAARTVLIALLRILGPIWPDRIELAGRNLGDTWPHPAAGGAGLVPFHKLSQWLAYSLIEPLARLGVEVTDTDALSGLAEYRNGGLFIDTGVIVPRRPAATTTAFAPSSELVVEWRALSVCLLDEIAGLVRRELGRDRRQLPLASILQGGTWTAGRRLAAALRPDGRPPIAIVSDGALF